MNEQTYFTFDIETTGKPNGYGPFTKLFRFENCRMIELSWTVCNLKHEILKSKSYFIKYPGLHIPKDTTEYNGITEKMVQDNGVELMKIANSFINDLGRSSFVVGYNILFDLDVLRSEFYRLGKSFYIKSLTKKKKLCIMLKTHLLWKELGFSLEEKSTLGNIYRLLFDEEFEGHRGENDVIATIEIFREYDSRGLIDLEKDLIINEKLIDSQLFVHQKDNKSNKPKNGIIYGNKPYDPHPFQVNMLLNRVKPIYNDDAKNRKKYVNDKYSPTCYFCNTKFEKYLRIDQINGDLNHIDWDTFVHSCVFCFNIRHKWDNPMNAMTYRKSKMNQAEIVQRTYKLYQIKDSIPDFIEIDPDSEEIDFKTAVQEIKKGNPEIKAFLKEFIAVFKFLV